MLLIARRNIPIDTPNGIAWRQVEVDINPLLEAAKLVCDNPTDAAVEQLRQALENLDQKSYTLNENIAVT